MTQAKTAPIENPESQNIDKLREILFGSQIRRLEEHLQKLKRESAQDLQAVAQDLSRKLESVESCTRHEFQAAVDRYDSEMKNRLVERAELNEKIDAGLKALEKKITQMARSSEVTHKDLIELIMERTKVLSSHLNEVEKALQADLRTRTEHLESDKVSRGHLSEVLSTLSDQLKGPQSEHDSPQV